MRIKNRKLISACALTLAAFAVISLSSLGVPAAPNPPAHEMKFKNLKILPKNTTPQQLREVMHSFSVALGYHCDNCHEHVAGDPNPMHMDFASDAKPEKKEARDMMRMMMKINRKYFDIKSRNFVAAKFRVTCYTCHHGDHLPLGMPLAGADGADHGMPPMHHDMH